MTEKDITRIKVRKHPISIIGIKLLMAEMAHTHAGNPDEDVRSTIVEGLGRDNHISNSARDDYGKAFVREFRKFLGQPYSEENSGQLDVKVLGIGCAQCHNLTQTVMEVLTEMGIPCRRGPRDRSQGDRQVQCEGIPGAGRQRQGFGGRQCPAT